MELLAHLTMIDGIRIEQSLREHCLKTAEYASECLKNSNLYHAGYLAGILHDMGKATRVYNAYLEKAFAGEKVIRGSINHTFAGVVCLLEKYHQEDSDVWERMTCEIVGYAIGSHHGMFDCIDLDGKNGFIHRLKKDKSEICYDEAIDNFFNQVISEKEIEMYFQKAMCEVKAFFAEVRKSYDKNPGKVWSQVSMLTRLLLSAVIYGDRRDTSEFMTQKMRQQGLNISWEKQREYFEDKIQGFHSSTALNQVRKEISNQCLEAAYRPSGIYRLSVPTGAGKTLCTLRYALAHAEKYEKKRIIFIIPLLSVLEQNAKVIREYISDEKLILEHHSNVVREKNLTDEMDQYELLNTDWDAPIVVSTLVQLLNMLFTSQTSAVGRMQALCNSVIVIDEVQSLPKKTTVMFNMAMNFLQQFCNATIILSSATQPCFEELKWPIRLADNPDMVTLSSVQMEVFERSEIIDCTDPYGMDFDECVSFCGERMEVHNSLLVICNTKTEARILFEKLQAQADDRGWDIFHLSTSMCQSHRMNTMEELQKKLSFLQKNLQNQKKVRKLICISTQLVEAGVDFSFEGVVRILAGIDNLAQAAGRCNRSNEYKGKGKVYLINLKNENLRMLREIVNAQNCTRKVLAYRGASDDESLIGPSATHDFYKYLFDATKDEIKYPVKDYGATIYLADLLANHNESAENNESKRYVLHQPFVTIGREFKVFDENTIDVLVPYGNGAALIEKLHKIEGSLFDLNKLQDVMKETKQYAISIYQWQKEKLDTAGLLHHVCGGRILVLDENAYSCDIGLRIMEEQPVENFIM